MRRVDFGSASLASIAMILWLVAVVVAHPTTSGIRVRVTERVELCGSRDRDTIVVVASDGGWTLDSRTISREQVRVVLAERFHRRAERIVYVQAALDAPFSELAEAAAAVAPHCDVVALITPATDSREGCLMLTLPGQTR